MRTLTTTGSRPPPPLVKELFAAPSNFQGFLKKRMGKSEIFGPIIQVSGIAADDLTARNPCHFLEDRVDK